MSKIETSRQLKVYKDRSAKVVLNMNLMTNKMMMIIK